MEVIDGLAAVVPGVDDSAIAFAEPFVAGDLSCDREEMTEQGRVMRSGFGERDQVFARGNEDVRGSLRIDVGEGVALVVLKDGCRWDGSLDDFAEEAAHDAHSVQDCQFTVLGS